MGGVGCGEVDTERWAGSGTVRRMEGTVEGEWGGDQGLCRYGSWWGGVCCNVAEDMVLNGRRLLGSEWGEVTWRAIASDTSFQYYVPTAG